MASLSVTCKPNAVDPYACLRETRAAVPNGHPVARIADVHAPL